MRDPWVDVPGNRPTKQQLAARGLSVRAHRESGWQIWRVECHSRIAQLRIVAHSARFVTFRAAALYGLSLRGSRSQYARLEAVVSQLEAHQPGHDTLDEGCRTRLHSELLQLLAAIPDSFEPVQAPRYEVLTPIAETLVASFSFPKEDYREQVNARRAAAQAASTWADVTHTYLVSEGARREVHPHEGPWQR